MTRILVCAAAIAVLVACSEKSVAPESPRGAQRIVSLAPNLTELVHTVGAGDQLVGVSAWSDYPRSVLKLPVVGDAFAIDQEQLALLAPDLLLVWESGTPAHVVDELKSRGYNVVTVRTRSVDDVALALLQLGELTGHAGKAEIAAADFRREIAALRERHRDMERISVFYQVAARPLYTVNGEHYLSELIELCGGTNVFEDLSSLAPTVDVEAVVDRDPEVMLASTDAGDDAFVEWQRWPELRANRLGNQFLLPGDEIGRATTRLTVAGQAMCVALDQARRNRESATTAIP